MKRSVLFSVFSVAVLGALAGSAIYSRLADPVATVLAKGQPAPPSSPAGTWWGIARPCPASFADFDHAALCQQICGQCTAVTGALPPEVPMMPSILSDGNIVVNDSGSIAVFHTTAQGQWAADPDPYQPQIPGRVRYQASFVWLQGSPDKLGKVNPDPNVPEVNRQFGGVARPRLVMYFDPQNPDAMFGYIQPHFFSIVNPATGLVNVLPASIAGAFEGTHQTAINFLGPLPAGCQLDKGCLGTYHFTIHRVKANVPNSN